MEKDALKKKKISDTPGVYFFLGRQKEILYIGKATSLRSRIQSYFTDDIPSKRSELIAGLVRTADSIEWTTTDSVLEALILETNLIRTHKPRFNTRAKDDKSFNHIIITNEEFPRVVVVRGKDLAKMFAEGSIAYEYGPYPHGALFKAALNIIRKIFKFYDTKKPLGAMRSKMGRGIIDFNRQIGLYPSNVTKKEYTDTIRHIRLFFEGKKKVILRELKASMYAYAKKMEFEKAEVQKRKIFALQHIQDVALIKNESRASRDNRRVRIEAYDVAHLGGKDMVGVMTVVLDGEAEQSEYRKFLIRRVTSSNDPAALTEILERRLAHPEWTYPHIIVVDGNIIQKNAAERVLKKYGMLIPVVAVVKDERHKVKRIIAPRKMLADYESDIVRANAEAHRFSIAYHRNTRTKRHLS